MYTQAIVFFNIQQRLAILSDIMRRSMNRFYNTEKPSNGAAHRLYCFFDSNFVGNSFRNYPDVSSNT